jgi:hypothetical protein
MFKPNPSIEWLEKALKNEDDFPGFCGPIKLTAEDYKALLKLLEKEPNKNLKKIMKEHKNLLV